MTSSRAGRHPTSTPNARVHPCETSCARVTLSRSPKMSRWLMNARGGVLADKVLGLTPARTRREQDTRVVLLDALRGVCFVFMTIDHLPGNPLHRFSNPEYGFFGFFTGALGFVFLSGVVVGRVYDKERVLNGTGSMCRRVLRRMRALYFTQILMCVLVVAAVELHLR